MAVRRLAAEQPNDFSFTPDNVAWAEKQIEKFPEGRQASAVIPLLWRAQEQYRQPDRWPAPIKQGLTDQPDTGGLVVGS